MNTVQRTAKNIIFLQAAGILSGFLGFAGTAYLARVLEPENFGKIAFAMAILSFFLIFIHLGLDTIGTREIARHNDSLKKYVGNIFFIKTLFGIITISLMVLVVLFILFINNSSEVKYLIILYVLTLLPLIFHFDWVFKGVEKMEYTGLALVTKTLFLVALYFIIIKSPKQILLVPVIQFVANLAAVLVLLFIFHKYYGSIQLKIDTALCRQLVKKALPIGIYIFMVTILNYTDSIMLGFMKSKAEVGYYNAAYKIIWLLLGFASAYFDAIFPLISKFYTSSLAKLELLLNYTVKLMIGFSLPLAVGGTMTARSIMNLIYGNRYDDGIIAFQLLVLAVPVISINTVFVWALLGCDRQKRCLKVIILQAVVNVSLNFLLIPAWGISGAAIAVIAAQSVGIFFYFRAFREVVYIEIFRQFLKPAAACLLMVIFLYFSQIIYSFNVFFSIFGGALIYLLMLLLLKAITQEDYMVLKELKGL